MSRNGKILNVILKENNLKPANLMADCVIWTRGNRQNAKEKWVVYYILATPLISEGIQTVIVDEKGKLRLKGKHGTDHYTMLMSLKINNMRKATCKETWKLDSAEGWKLNIEKMKNAKNKEKNPMRQLWNGRDNHQEHPQKHCRNKKRTDKITRPMLKRRTTLGRLISIKPNMVKPLRQPITDLRNFEKHFWFYIERKLKVAQSQVE